MAATLDWALQQPWARLTNRVLGDSPEAQARLAQYAGRVLRVRMAIFDLKLRVGIDGLVEVAQHDAVVDLEVTVPPAALAQLAARNEAAIRQLAFTGDAEFAQELGFLLRNLDWDFEEDLSRFTGDVVAHRAVGAVKAFDAWRREAADRLGANVAEYLTEERPALVPRREVEAFVIAVDALRDDIARAEKRLAALEGQQPSPSA